MFLVAQVIHDDVFEPYFCVFRENKSDFSVVDARDIV